MNKLIAESHKLYDQYYSSKTDNVVDKSQYSDFLKKFKIKNIVLRNNTIELIESMEPVHGIIILRDKNIIYTKRGKNCQIQGPYKNTSKPSN